MASLAEPGSPLPNAIQSTPEVFPEPTPLAAAPAEATSSVSDLAISANTPDPLAASLPSYTDRFMDFLQTGGPVVWILMGFSVIALSMLLVKLWQLMLLQPERTGDVDQALSFYQQNNTDAALARLKQNRPVSALVHAAIELQTQLAPELLQEELNRLAQKQLNQLRGFLRPLEIIATLSPLLGLLGTVLGMILAFQQMEAAGSQVDPATLSGGIWQALLTTAVGLSVAIPVLIAHAWLERKNERVAATMNDAVTRVFTGKKALDTQHNGAIKRAA
ncbi:MotA/TolQ/ExbB proton channel family protein [Neptuniibacter sp. CAU 1671]|uniref:MotA/TolQ/ExbB proton channel family protein n=1 Tax=Neptuniibacter sp. CAU 1671 TaxID=3032593 RepID=UPI0023DB498F|nr:MotA/TolQ/ExbB proton channel family protein [Neptuniibacter sp. CAU 1671]MDF2182812.1 MotA/TolQ/ExbB proton channel family protein [Neptuniibacter sp. CAU 1671]